MVRKYWARSVRGVGGRASRCRDVWEDVVVLFKDEGVWNCHAEMMLGVEVDTPHTNTPKCRAKHLGVHRSQKYRYLFHY